MNDWTPTPEHRIRWSVSSNDVVANERWNLQLTVCQCQGEVRSRKTSGDLTREPGSTSRPRALCLGYGIRRVSGDLCGGFQLLRRSPTTRIGRGAKAKGKADFPNLSRRYKYGNIIGDPDKKWRLKRQEGLNEEVVKLEDLRPMLGMFRHSKSRFMIDEDMK